MADVLIVDDDRDITELLAMILESAGHTFRIAYNGRGGLELIAERKPELVLLDLDMPVMSGTEMAYMLLAHDLGDEDIPLVLLSGNVDLPRVAARVGTPYYLAKPYDADALLRLVVRVAHERIPPRPRQGG